MTRPNFCPRCGKPLQADLISPFSVGPKDYADGAYTAICRGNDSFCWQGDIYPENEKRGGYTEEDKRERFKATVEREAGRLDKLFDTLALYYIEYQDRVGAHLKAMSEAEIRAFMVRCDASQNESQATCHSFKSHAVDLKRQAEIEVGYRWHMLHVKELGNPDSYCLYHACDMRDCAAQHED